jgi:hypothetical protein
MTINLNLPPELEHELGAEASRLNLTISEYILRILSNRQEKSFPKTTLNDVAGCLKYLGEPKTIEDMNDAIRQGIEEQWDGCS